MKSIVLVAAFSLLAATPALAKKAPPPAADPAQEVIQAEQAFDAYTFQHGYTHGFHLYSAGDGVSLGAHGPKPTHVELSDAIAKNPAETDAPSKLRWWPAHVGVSESGDLAYDLGGWTNGDDADGGWFFTVWKRQADGQWRWQVDSGAGSGPVAQLPAKQPILIDFKPAGVSATAAADIVQSEAVLDKALGEQAPLTAYDGFLADSAIVSVEDAPPAQNAEAYAVALAKRPAGLTWVADRSDVSKAGDYAYVLGHAEDSAKTAKGYYVRVWRKDGPAMADWHIVADIFHAAP